MNSDKRSYGTNFTEGSLLPMLVAFILPFLAASLLNNFYNIVDTIVVGQFIGSIGTSAVTSGGKMLHCYSMVCMGLSGAGQVLLAQQMGASKRSEIGRTIGTLLTSLIVTSIICAAATLFLAGSIVSWLNTPAEVVPGAYSYMCITSAGLPLIFGYEAISAVLRGMGDSKSPLLYVGIATVLNVILDLVFVISFGMGAGGTALATVISQGVAFVVSVIRLYRDREKFGFDFKPASFKVHGPTLKTLLRIGIPMALSGAMIQVSQIILISRVNLYGVAQSAAHGIGDKVLTISNVFVSSIQSAGGAVLAQNFAADRKDRVVKTVHYCLWMSLGVSAVLAVPSIIFNRQIFGIFIRDEAVLAYSLPFMAIAVLLYFLSSIQGAYQIVVTGTGNARLSFIGGFLDSIVLRIGLGVLLGEFMGMEVTGYFLGTVLARFGPISVSFVYYVTGAWKKFKKLV